MNEVQPIRDQELINKMKSILMKRSYRDWFIFTMGINTGLRISDLLQLKVDDVKNKTHISIHEQKTGKIKRFRINNDLREHIDRYVENMSDESYLFKSRRGNKPIKRVQAYKILKVAAREAGIDEIGTHTLRKTFGYHFYQRTKDVALLQDIFNHSAPSITLRYIGINQDIIDQAVEEFSL
ncbi:site-specific integrase [Tenuibacillus multivorans]|uniref:Phage integrase family protein n=1 Tax=Tenuibacillus multivorans TaxID=237069 RepID=A0A1H0DF50_9BACI|nr:site-specific integrase [Tenuibacillus multivorans]GEL76578.1 site-specific recombinase [Tenuibacillus multivorans]SDN68764.1 Phage integrase family protein [Tenuibacillus multivorans]